MATGTVAMEVEAAAEDTGAAVAGGDMAVAAAVVVAAATAAATAARPLTVEAGVTAVVVAAAAGVGQLLTFLPFRKTTPAQFPQKRRNGAKKMTFRAPVAAKVGNLNKFVFRAAPQTSFVRCVTFVVGFLLLLAATSVEIST